MPKPLSGSLLTRRLADDTLIVDVKIRSERRTLGPASDWPEARARRLLERRLLPAAQLRQDWTVLIPGAGSGGSTAVPSADALTVREAATDYVEALSRYENPNTVSAYRSPVVKHLLPFLAFVDEERTVDRTLGELDEALMLRFVATKQAERPILQDIAETLAELDTDVRSDPELLRQQLDPEEWRLLCRYGQRGGQRMVLDPAAGGLISLSSRGLSNNEINRCLARMRDIVRIANRRYKLGLDDPTQGCSLPRRDPSREWLHPVQLQALLEAAQTLDANPAQDAYRHHGRYSAILALGLLGPRVSEFGAARWRDLSAEGLFIPEAKTSAGRRHLELPTIVRTALDRRRAELDPRPAEWIWASAAGTKRDRNNVRNRLLAPVLELAADLLEERGQRPLPARVDAEGNPTGVRVTPHVFRRTAMTYWAWADRNQRWAMGQAGHKSAKMTLEAYQQTFPRDPDARTQVVAWLRGAGDEPA
jgi:integrase